LTFGRKLNLSSFEADWFVLENEFCRKEFGTAERLGQHSWILGTMNSFSSLIQRFVQNKT
jgi:hypothetical protein